MQEHLLTFEQQWSDQASGRTLPKFVTEELHKYMDCGILGRDRNSLHQVQVPASLRITSHGRSRAYCRSCSTSANRAPPGPSTDSKDRGEFLCLE
jgi:hypothetical protein